MEMNNLVTDAAIDAAEIARRLSPDREDALPHVLNAAAPLIAAEALRQAGIYICPDDTGVECRAELKRLADELEGK